MKTLIVAFALLLAGCGKDGATGPAGAAGAKGADGTDNRIVASVFCAGTVTGLSGAAGTALNGLGVNYSAALTNAGDVFATASIDTGAYQIGNSAFYSANQNGAQTGGVAFTADFATANGGWWAVSLDRSTLVVTAVYTDSSLGGQSPVTMTFASSACQSHTY